MTLLLLQKAVADQDEMAEPELVLIAPSRDGDSDLARPVDAAQQSQVAAYIADWTQEERQALRDEAPIKDFKTPFRGGTLHFVRALFVQPEFILCSLKLTFESL